MNQLIFLFLFFSSFVWGQSEPKPLDATIPNGNAEAGAEDSGSSSAIAGFLNKNKFIYDENEGRDPFKPYRDPAQPVANPQPKTPTVEKAIPPEDRRTITTAIIPDDITLVGIIYNPPSSVAMITVNGAPGFFRLKRGGAVGRSEGKVLNIEKDSVEIEHMKDFDGQKFPEKITLKLRNKKN